MRFGGKITFSIIGAYCEDFINELLRRKIPLSKLRTENNIIYAQTNGNSYRTIARLSRKYGVRVRIKKKSGVYFRLYQFRKRPGLLVGAVVSSFMVLTLRMFVWHIDIHGNNELSSDYMLGLLENYGFTAGVLANNTDALDAERHIMLMSDKIRWINIEVNGSRADVYMSENSSREVPEVDLKTPCNIVASRSGVITDAKVTSGKLMYEAGSGVAEGSVIVSGFVSSGDSLILVHSDAEIIAEFTENAEFSMNYTTVEKVPSDNTFTHRQIMLLGIVIPLDSNDRVTRNTVCTQTTEQCRLFGFDLPLRIRNDKYSEYKEITVTRRSDDVRKLLEQQLELYIYNFMKDYEVLDISKNFEESAEGISLRASIKLKGNIAAKKPIYEH